MPPRRPRPMIAVQTPTGLHFGQVYSLDAERMSFEMDAVLALGEEYTWRMELEGYRETAMGTFVVERSSGSHHHEVPVHHARILAVSDADRSLFDGWIEDMAGGGTSRRLERAPESYSDPGLGRMMRGASRNEARVAIERIDARQARSRSNTASTPASEDSDPFGITKETSRSPAFGPASGRAAIRDALRASLTSRSERRDAPAPGPHAREAQPRPSRPPPPSSPTSTESAHSGAMPPPRPSGAGTRQATRGSVRPPVSEPSQPSSRSASGQARRNRPNAPEWLRDAISRSTSESVEPPPSRPPAWLQAMREAAGRTTTEPPDDTQEGPALTIEPPTEDDPTEQGPPDPRPARPDPTYLYETSGKTPQVTVIWHTTASFAREWDTHLRGSGIFVPNPRLGGHGDALQVTLRLPSGSTVSCTGRVVAPMVTGVGVALELSHDQQRSIAQEAR